MHGQRCVTNGACHAGLGRLSTARSSCPYFLRAREPGGNERGELCPRASPSGSTHVSPFSTSHGSSPLFGVEAVGAQRVPATRTSNIPVDSDAPSLSSALPPVPVAKESADGGPGGQLRAQGLDVRRRLDNELPLHEPNASVGTGASSSFPFATKICPEASPHLDCSVPILQHFSDIGRLQVDAARFKVCGHVLFRA